jgi:hypothetical protein
MSKLAWDVTGEHIYETGVDRGVLYPQVDGEYPKGIAWSGLTSVAENPSGAEDTALYADNIKYLNLKSAEELGATIECYSYPDEWMECDGSAEVIPGVNLGQQKRNTFGLSYRTKIGNDTKGDDYGYKIHLLYGCSASPSERTYQSVNDSPDAISFSYDVTTTPVTVDGYKATSSIVIDSTKIDATALAKIEAILYGTDATSGEDATEGTDARLPLPSELISILSVEG